MSTLTLRNVPDTAYDALKERAERHRRSMEAEARTILEEAVCPDVRLRMGDALTMLGRQSGLTDADLAALTRALDEVRPA